MRKMEHIGEVVDIRDGEAVVRLRGDTSAACGFSCSCASMGPEARTVRVEAEGLEVGDTVQVAIPAYTGYLSGFVVFILPIALVVAGIAVGGMLEPGQANDIGPIVGGVIGFALAIGVAVAVNRALGRAERFEVRRIRRGGGH